MTACYFCGHEDGEWLTLLVCQVGHAQTFRLFHTASGQREGMGRWDGSGEPNQRWTICRLGHMRPRPIAQSGRRSAWHQRLVAWALRADAAPTDAPAEPLRESPNVIRLLGSTGSGKSQLVRALRFEAQTPDPTFCMIEGISASAIDIDRLPSPAEGPTLDDGALLPTTSFDKTARDTLHNYLAYLGGWEQAQELDDLLARLLPFATGEEIRDWGSVRTPYVLTTYQERGGATAKSITPIIDLPGEIVRHLSGGTGSDEPLPPMSRSDLAQLSYTHQFVAVIDCMSLGGVFGALDPAEREAALRKRSNVTPEVAHRMSRKETESLLVFLQSMGRVADGATRSIPLTLCLAKSDALHRILARRQVAHRGLDRWSFLWADATDKAAALNAFVEAGAAALVHLCGFDGARTAAADRLLQPISALPGGQRFARAMALSASLLADLGDSGAFHRLIVSEGPVDLNLPGGGIVSMESARDYWFLSTAGFDLMARDVACSVLVQALLATDYGRDRVAGISAHSSHLRFALTSTREFLPGDGPVRADDDPRARLAENSGVLQVLADVLQGALR